LNGQLPSAGYSATPLPRKLGMKPGQAAAFVALPPSLAALADAEPFSLTERTATAGELATPDRFDLIHAFYTERARLRQDVPLLRAAIRPAGMVWVSWPKKAAKVPTDVTEDLVRHEALKAGLVDVKVCAVDEVWSGRKLVIPVKDRPDG
jgi:hypothetical protein